ncbi:MAG: Gfo/Idh/MocA family oxidoreductase, partial [Ilumatobacteraceae bacterium]
RFESGVLGQFHVAWAAASAPGFRLEIAGNRGRIVVTAAGTMPSEGAAISVARDHGALEEVDVPVRLRVDSGIEPVEGWLVDPRPALALAFGHMVGAMAGTHEARPSFERAHHVQGIIEAVQRSSAERTWVRPLDASGDERSSTR